VPYAPGSGTTISTAHSWAAAGPSPPRILIPVSCSLAHCADVTHDAGTTHDLPGDAHAPGSVLLLERETIDGDRVRPVLHTPTNA